MEVLLIRDIKGKEQLVFKRDKGNELDDMGSKVDDFEILQVLGEGSFGYIAKVKSRLNHKIYAMKKIDLSKIKEQKVINLMMNETKILSELDNPMIVKYYKTFNEDGALFILMEFMDNGDIGGIYKASKTLGKPIPEEKIYDITNHDGEVISISFNSEDSRTPISKSEAISLAPRVKAL